MKLDPVDQEGRYPKSQHGPADHDAEYNAEACHAGIAVKEMSVDHICKCIWQIDHKDARLIAAPVSLPEPLPRP